MRFHKNEILRKLEVGKVYTGYQLSNFLTDNHNVIILSEDGRISDSNDVKYKVVNENEKFIHQKCPMSHRTYLIPNAESLIYEAKRM